MATSPQVRLSRTPPLFERGALAVVGFSFGSGCLPPRASSCGRVRLQRPTRIAPTPQSHSGDREQSASRTTPMRNSVSGGKHPRQRLPCSGIEHGDPGASGLPVRRHDISDQQRQRPAHQQRDRREQTSAIAVRAAYDPVVMTYQPFASAGYAVTRRTIDQSREEARDHRRPSRRSSARVAVRPSGSSGFGRYRRSTSGPPGSCPRRGPSMNTATTADAE